MAYPFKRFPRFSEFKAILEKNYGCRYKELPVTLTDAQGRPFTVHYFERTVNGKVLSSVVEDLGGDCLSPSLQRRICERLDIDPGATGFEVEIMEFREPRQTQT